MNVAETELILQLVTVLQATMMMDILVNVQNANATAILAMQMDALHVLESELQHQDVVAQKVTIKLVP